MTTNHAYALYDRRTGQRVGMGAVGLTLQQAERNLQEVRDRDARGGRPDLHDVVPHLAVIALTDATWGSQPGDVIAASCCPPTTAPTAACVKRHYRAGTVPCPQSLADAAASRAQRKAQR